MTALEDLTAGASVRGLLASGAATVESVQWIGEQAVKVTFRDGKERQYGFGPLINLAAPNQWRSPGAAGRSS